MEDIAITETEKLETEETKNYAREFAIHQDELDENLKKFFKIDPSVDDELVNYNKELKHLKSQIEDIERKISLNYTKKYTMNYTPVKSAIINYRDRQGNNHYYSTPDGQGIDIERLKINRDDVRIYSIDYKNGEVTVLGGYCLELGAIVMKTFSCQVANDNNSVKLKILHEQVYSLISNKAVTTTLSGVILDTIVDLGYRTEKKIDMTDFLEKFYGRKFTQRNIINLYDLRTALANNKNFETVIKTAPECILYPLLMARTSEQQPVYQMIGLTKEGYNESVNKGVIAEMYSLGKYIKNYSVFNKTEHEWINLILKCKTYQEDLDFYNIDYHYGYNRIFGKCELLNNLAANYFAYSAIRSYYSFGSYVEYIIKGSIDQGYQGLNSFITSLRDYLCMCDDQKIKPILFSNNLRQTHDITARNHSITVNPEMEEKFKHQYVDFKTWKHDDYVVVAPKESSDLKHEGDTLNHCVASYIKKVIDGDSLIYFLRKDPVVSLLTLQVKEGKIVQARGLNNRQPNKEEIEVVEKFAKARALELAY